MIDELRTNNMFLWKYTNIKLNKHIEFIPWEEFLAGRKLGEFGCFWERGEVNWPKPFENGALGEFTQTCQKYS